MSSDLTIPHSSGTELEVSRTAIHPGETISFKGRCNDQFPDPIAFVALSIALADGDPRRPAAEAGEQATSIELPTDGDRRFSGELVAPAGLLPGQFQINMMCTFEDMAGSNYGPIPIEVVAAGAAFPAGPKGGSDGASMMPVIGAAALAAVAVAVVVRRRTKSQAVE